MVTYAWLAKSATERTKINQIMLQLKTRQHFKALTHVRTFVGKK